MTDQLPASPSAAYTELLRLLREISTINSVTAQLSWDQETLMPPKGSQLRADQLASLSAIVHERATSPRFGELLTQSEADSALAGDDEAQANLREIRRDYDRAVKLPPDLVREVAETSSLAMHAWREAREKSDFGKFAPWLEKTVSLNRRTAQALGWPEGGEMYDALLDGFEPGMTAAAVSRTFDALRAGLSPLIRAVAESGVRVDTSWQRTRVPIPRQVELNRAIIQRMDFDLDAGRLDESTHPFCEGNGPGDTRMTTRYAEDQLVMTVSSTMHETGHGIYEQNLPKAERFGQPLAQAASFGIHESQSRMWENMVGRSRPFWEWVLPELRQAAGGAFDGVDVETAYRSMNTVSPGLIRVDADEATYNLHIMLRFDLERAMLSGDLAVADVPAAWNERMRADVGVEVPDDARGCLQDIHWSMGALGYFPTYTLGNLYAAQFWSTLREALPGLDDDLRRGEFGGIRGWLTENVHRHGRRFTPPELCERITGRPLSHQPLLDYLAAKIRPIYGI